MKYTISYSGKVVIEGCAVREIFLAQEFDETTPIESAYDKVRNKIEMWIKKETEQFSPETKPLQPKPKVMTIEDVTKKFPQDLAGLLYFEDIGHSILIKPRHYLGQDSFRKISDIVKQQVGGDYVSAGKDSHFIVNKKGASPKQKTKGTS